MVQNSRNQRQLFYKNGIQFKLNKKKKNRLKVHVKTECPADLLWPPSFWMTVPSQLWQNAKWFTHILVLGLSDSAKDGVTGIKMIYVRVWIMNDDDSSLLSWSQYASISYMLQGKSWQDLFFKKLREEKK